jgi:cytochrome bd-type quinol oxidase subunit 2
VDANGSNQGQLRDAYVPSRRVRVASDVAALCAVALLIGLLGSGITWWGRSELFDLASNSREAVKMGLGYLAGPLLILITLPLVLGRSRQVALRRYFRARLAAAALLWLVGLALLIAKVSGLDGYDVEAGTYVAAGLLCLGFCATVAMWPGDLPIVRVDRNGMVREPATAGAQPARSPTGP